VERCLKLTKLLSMQDQVWFLNHRFCTSARLIYGCGLCCFLAGGRPAWQMNESVIKIVDGENWCACTAGRRCRCSRVALMQQLEWQPAWLVPAVVIDSWDWSAALVGSAAGDGCRHTASLAFSRYSSGFRTCCLWVGWRHFGANPDLVGAVLRKLMSLKL